jgi:precorrin-6Y C5,15-methyltransferase (decarboxylating)
MIDSIAWLSVVGISENGLDGLGTQARDAIAQASLVIGGKRHLALAAEAISGESMLWPSPIETCIPALLARKPQAVCVLASGDPFTYGVGSTLVRYIPLQEMRVFPAPSVFSLAAARLGWALQDTVTIGLNGRPLEKIIPHLQPGARIIALSTDGATPAMLAALLTRQGFGACKMMVLEHLGGPLERIRHAQADSMAWGDVAALNCVALVIAGDAAAKQHALPLAAGLEDDRFEHDGKMTKREMRAVTLSALGAGSIAIEWMLRHPDNRAIGIEPLAARAQRAARNAQALGVPGLQIINGEAPAALAGLDAPDAVFIGGGMTAAGLLDAVWPRLKPGGRLVVNAISLETEALLLAAFRQYGGRLIRLGVERADVVGAMTGWRPAMTVMQWSVTK